ncbi:MAG: hypothetical protein K0Q55_771 [Verrucomicrobia bacterium]|nr:hypothetical protein [Verrucomicrobiota bacterium]
MTIDPKLHRIVAAQPFPLPFYRPHLDHWKGAKHNSPRTYLNLERQRRSVTKPNVVPRLRDYVG